MALRQSQRAPSASRRVPTGCGTFWSGDVVAITDRCLHRAGRLGTACERFYAKLLSWPIDCGCGSIEQLTQGGDPQVTVPGIARAWPLGRPLDGGSEKGPESASEAVQIRVDRSCHRVLRSSEHADGVGSVSLWSLREQEGDVAVVCNVWALTGRGCARAELRCVPGTYVPGLWLC